LLIRHLFVKQMLAARKKEQEIKPILGDIPAFFNYLINFCFNVEALGT